MFRLKLLLAAFVAALMLAFVGPLAFGATSALAAPPQPLVPLPRHHIPFHGGQVRFLDPDHDHDVDVVVVHPVRVVRPVVVVTRPVFVTPVFVTPVQTQTFFWLSFGPGWNAQWSLSQLQRFCQQYNQAVMADPAAFNQSVQAVCASMV